MICNIAPSPLLIVIPASFLSFPLPPSLHILLVLIIPLISPLCFTFVLLACPFLSPTICLSNMAVLPQLGAFPGNETTNTVPPQHNGPQFCFCHSCYMRSTAKTERKKKAVCFTSLYNYYWTTELNSQTTFFPQKIQKM